MEFFKDLMGSGTFRRWGIGLAITGLIVANGKLGLGLTIETLGMITAMGISLVLGSNYKEAKVAIADATVMVAESEANAKINATTVIPPVSETEASVIVARQR